MLYTGNPWHDGANDTVIARLTNKNITETVEPTLRSGIHRVLETPAPGQSSPVGLLAVAADSRGDEKIAVVLLSDLVEHTTKVDLNRTVSASDAQAAAQLVPAVDLSGVPVAMYGVAKTADSVAAPDDWAAAVRTFAVAVCQRSSAASCLVRTQYPTDQAGV